jgi:uncharacterized protein
MTDIQQTGTLAERWSEGLGEGKLLIQVCGDCGKPNMYPRYRCPFCHSDNLGYEPSAGVGTLHSYTVVRAVPPRDFEAELPYALGVVKLDEGVQLAVRLAPTGEESWDGYACDARVTFVPEGDPHGRAVAWFRLGDPR